MVNLVYNDFQSIIGITDVFRQTAVDVVMQTDVVIGMHEVGAAGTDAAGKSDGIAYELVGVMGLVPTQGVLNEHINAFEQLHLAVADRLHVSDIGKVANAITEDGQAVVHHLEGQDVQVADVQVVVGMDGVEVDGWHTGVFLLGKAVGHRLVKACGTDFIGVDVGVTETAVGAQIVDSTHVVVVGVGDEYAVDLAELLL